MGINNKNDLYRIIVEKEKEAIIVIQHHKIQFANPKAIEMSGYSQKELISMPFQELIYPDDHAIALDYAQKALQEEQSSQIFQLRLIDKKGNLKWVEINLVMINWGEGTASLYFFTDIDERIRIEQERKEMEQKAQVASHLTAVGEMASGIAHEINNPLTSIVLFSQLLMEEDLSKSVKRDVKAIHDSALRATNTIRRLLAFARQQLLEKSYIDINEILEVTIELRKYSLETSNIKVTTDFDHNLSLTVADSDQLQQVFLNIILNAETEMKEKYGKGNLLIKTKQVDNLIQISFKDNGPGIPKENLKKIFNPFFTTHEVGRGTGLGLSVCHGIISEHGGRIYAESTLGHGATFILELPVVTKELKTTEELHPVPAKASTKGKILIIDDEQSILNSLSRLFAREGHITETADNCQTALKKIINKNFDVILLDIKLPDMTGMDLYDELQKIDNNLIKKIIFITGDNMDLLTQKFLNKSKARYFAKPFDYKMLLSEINKSLTMTT